MEASYVEAANTVQINIGWLVSIVLVTAIAAYPVVTGIRGKRWSQPLLSLSAWIFLVRSTLLASFFYDAIQVEDSATTIDSGLLAGLEVSNTGIGSAAVSLFSPPAILGFDPMFWLGSICAICGVAFAIYERISQRKAARSESAINIPID